MRELELVGEVTDEHLVAIAKDLEGNKSITTLRVEGHAGGVILGILSAPVFREKGIRALTKMLSKNNAITHLELVRSLGRKRKVERFDRVEKKLILDGACSSKSLVKYTLNGVDYVMSDLRKKGKCPSSNPL